MNHREFFRSIGSISESKEGICSDLFHIPFFLFVFILAFKGNYVQLQRAVFMSLLARTGTHK